MTRRGAHVPKLHAATHRVWACLLWLVPGLATVSAALAADPAPTSPDAPHVVWDVSTLRCVQPGGTYARMTVLRNGETLCAYDRDGKLFARHSPDAGRTWREPVLVDAWPDGRLTNAELLQLHDGSIFYFFDQRPSSAFGERHNGGDPEPKKGVPLLPFAVGYARSIDNGQTWQPPVTLYRAGPEFGNGCWEPSAVQLPNGEVEVFFANEGPYRQSNEQEITLLRSRDDGRTWSPPEKVCFRPGHRDGMPVPLVLAGNGGVAFSIEDTGLSGTFKPVIIHTSLAEDWQRGTVGGDSPARWGALAKPLPPATYAGAPYLRQFAEGHTALSYQENPSGSMEGSRLVVCVGNAQARNFGNPTYPFPPTPGRGQLWGSLCIKGSDVVTAVCDANINGIAGIWSIDGRLATP